ncbi:cellulase family glycosylhydrolase [uncultured Duncaniella sp.]|uniref:cellulase family glycosylhydrolase n=1 Tax=uncultured Duncaniella sp. TaxID=2768039 RepID=UPI00272F8104|nr:cellulase family glycosylhydrolase [uncultured Duncaniella sp.]
MKILKSIFASMLLVSVCGFATTSCNDDDGYPNKVEFLSGEFVVSKSAMALAGTQPQTLTIKSPVRPSVSSDASWIHVGEVERSVSSSIYTCVISCDENSAYDVRTGSLTVTAGSESKTVTVTQYGAETVEIVSISSEGGVLAPNGGTFTVNYAATGEVNIEAPQWLTIVGSRSLNECSVEFRYSANNGEAGRSGDIVISLVSDPAISQIVTVSQEKTEISTDMSSSAIELAAKMYAGVNIGNTMEPPSGEGTWGTPVVNQEYIRGLKSLGFNAVRVPCAWDSHVSDAATNTIDPAWLDRVSEVVGYIVAEDMYAIVNIHWDGGWLETSCVNGYDKAVDKKQRDYWTQIANKLNVYDEHLLFAGMNEPGQQDQGAVNSSSINAIKAYQQTFVDAVRATGGNNAKRCLIHQTPYTNIDKGVSSEYSLPSDAVEGRSLVEVHFYDPSDFTLMGKDGEWGAGSKVKFYWGAANHIAGSDRNCTWGEESYVDSQFKKMQDAYVSKGIPVIVGEYAVEIRSTTDFPELDSDKWKASRASWTKYITESAKNHGCVPFYWETGGDINRNNGAAKNSYLINALMEGADAGKYPF